MSEMETVYEGKSRTRTSGGGKSRITIIAEAVEKAGLNLNRLKAVVNKETSRDLPLRVSKIEVDFFCGSEFSGRIRDKLEIAANVPLVHDSLHPDLEQVFFFQGGIP